MHADTFPDLDSSAQNGKAHFTNAVEPGAAPHLPSDVRRVLSYNYPKFGITEVYNFISEMKAIP
jgi:hypothetical protein